jgi:hypothetical protein
MSDVRREVVLYSRQCGIGALGPLDVTGEHVDPREIALVAEPHVFEPLRVFTIIEERARADGQAV